MSSETKRQYRVARQMIDMHSRLRDRYHRRALFLDLIILAGSVAFTATTFAGTEAIAQLGLEPTTTANALRVTSVLLFFASVAALRVDWKGLEGRHDEAVRRLADLVSVYRQARDEDGTWSNAVASELSRHYSELTTSIIPIPPKLFGRLKAQYLRAKEVSRLLDSRPGYPYALAHLVVRYRAFHD